MKLATRLAHLSVAPGYEGPTRVAHTHCIYRRRTGGVAGTDGLCHSYGSVARRPSSSARSALHGLVHQAARPNESTLGQSDATMLRSITSSLQGAGRSSTALFLTQSTNREAKADRIRLYEAASIGENRGLTQCAFCSQRQRDAYLNLASRKPPARQRAQHPATVVLEISIKRTSRLCSEG